MCAAGSRGQRWPGKLWRVTHQRRGGPWSEWPESMVKAYRYVRAELANWLCGALPSPHLVVEVDERDGRGWRVHERIDLRELAELERRENDDAG